MAKTGRKTTKTAKTATGSPRARKKTASGQAGARKTRGPTSSGGGSAARKAARRKRGPKAGSTTRRQPPTALDKLSPNEAEAVLRLLLALHPELRLEAEKLAQEAVCDVSYEDVADEVEDAVLGPDLDDLDGRAGRHSWGYTPPEEAAWEILEEGVRPFMDAMERQIELGFEKPAKATCQGIVLGLHRVRDAVGHGMLQYAPDFPAECAADAVDTLGKKSKVKQGKAWTLPETFLGEIFGWENLILRNQRGR